MRRYIYLFIGLLIVPTVCYAIGGIRIVKDDGTTLGVAGDPLVISGSGLGGADEKCHGITDPADADNHIFWRVNAASTVTEVYGIVEDATSVVVTFQECDSAGDTCSTIEAVTADVDGAADDGVDNASLDAGDWIRMDIGTVTGTPGHVVGCLTITRD